MVNGKFLFTSCFHFVHEDSRKSTLANSKNVENLFLIKGKEIPIVNLDPNKIENNTNKTNRNFILITLFTKQNYLMLSRDM